MAYPDEEYAGQPMWQSVVLFCCKGMIEVIVVILFFWLLVQVLFAKQLEVHLQVLLLVGLITFCLCLLLGCVLCWWRSRICCDEEIENVTSTEPVTVEHCLGSSGAPSSSSRLQYDELDGDTLDYPSTFTSPAPFERDFTSWSFSNEARSASERKEQPKTFFSLRRLSNPPLYKPIDTSHASLPTFPKLLSKALQRRCTVTGNSKSYQEHSRLSRHSPSTAEEPIPLVSMAYGSSASCKSSIAATPHLNFTLLFSPERRTLTITVLRLTGSSHRLDDVSTQACLPPLHPCLVQATIQGGLGRVVVLNVSSAEALQRCTLRIAVYTQDEHGLTGTALECVSHQDVQMSKGLSCPPKIFILLRYNPPTHRIKVAVLRADNLEMLVHCQVVIKLHHDGLVISSRGTKGASFAVWNSYFLFDLPPGNISHLPLTVEFIIMQSHARSQCKVLGRVLIGAEAADVGRAHWRDTCSLQGERSRWHTVQPEPSEKHTRLSNMYCI
ncbi:uncharacterized protein syt18b isoform X2 [Phyllopteryx taeniolatus]|uniref:uncharacterized protein syt18b isoform X2 n=1 Tax=Phyllopteryx taeniolatus TaxID=161469 RepID=UPI002AD2D157|nr:uncharacterized protein syt18b isoform X2 [Phyllopteryx taeniolatus]